MTRLCGKNILINTDGANAALIAGIQDYFKKESHNTHHADYVWSTQSKAEKEKVIVCFCVCVDSSKIALGFVYFMENSWQRKKL